MKEHYEAQSLYADLLFKAIEISWLHPIKKIKVIINAENFKNSHKRCCLWANKNR